MPVDGMSSAIFCHWARRRSASTSTAGCSSDTAPPSGSRCTRVEGEVVGADDEHLERGGDHLLVGDGLDALAVGLEEVDQVLGEGLVGSRGRHAPSNCASVTISAAMRSSRASGEPGEAPKPRRPSVTQSVAPTGSPKATAPVFLVAARRSKSSVSGRSTRLPSRSGLPVGPEAGGAELTVVTPRRYFTSDRALVCTASTRRATRKTAPLRCALLAPAVDPWVVHHPPRVTRSALATYGAWRESAADVGRSSPCGPGGLGRAQGSRRAAEKHAGDHPGDNRLQARRWWE